MHGVGTPTAWDGMGWDGHEAGGYYVCIKAKPIRTGEPHTVEELNYLVRQGQGVEVDNAQQQQQQRVL